MQLAILHLAHGGIPQAYQVMQEERHAAADVEGQVIQQETPASYNTHSFAEHNRIWTSDIHHAAPSACMPLSCTSLLSYFTVIVRLQT